MVRAHLGVALLAAAAVAYAPDAGLSAAGRRHPRSVGPALRPCPPGLKTVGVRELRAQPHLRGDCFAVRGRLRAAVAESHICNVRPVSTSEAASVPRCSRGWTLSDLSDPPVEVRNSSGDATPTVTLHDAGSLKEVSNLSIRPLLACNVDGAGKPIMPAGTRFRLPAYAYEDAPALNKGLGNMTVVAFGGTFRRDYQPEYPEYFEFMEVTHLCQLPKD